MATTSWAWTAAMLTVGALVSGCAAPTPTPEADDLVHADPQDLPLGQADFPIMGMVANETGPLDPNGWFRIFDDLTYQAPYAWVRVSVFVLGADAHPPGPAECDAWDGTESATHVLDVPTMGDGAVACRFDFAEMSSVFTYHVLTRNVLIRVEAAPLAALPDDDVADDLAAIAVVQMVLVDRAQPVRLLIDARGEPFGFQAPDLLEVAADSDYEYSFCVPRPATNTSACGPFPDTTNPTGGQPSYHFVLGPGTGFPPFSLTLSKDGILHGHVAPSEEGQRRTILVCAIDLAGDAVCRDVEIVVLQPSDIPDVVIEDDEPVVDDEEPMIDDEPAWILDSFECTLVSSQARQYPASGAETGWTWAVDVNGRVTGGVGDTFSVGLSTNYYMALDQAAMDSGWTVAQPNDPSDYEPRWTLERAAGEPATGAWSIHAVFSDWEYDVFVADYDATFHMSGQIGQVFDNADAQCPM